MAVITILTCFLNSMLSSVYFNLKFWISFLKYFSNSSNFYFLIRLIGSYIKHYLGGAEFKSHISPITFGFGLLLTHSFTTTITLTNPPLPSTTQNNQPRCPSPLIRDVGPFTRPQLTSEARLHHSLSPFPKGYGQFSVRWRFDGGLAHAVHLENKLSFEGDWGSEKHQGDP